MLRCPLLPIDGDELQDLMAHAVACLHCGANVLTAPALGDREAAALLAHLLDAHPAVVSQSTSLAELLHNFKVSTTD